MFFDPEDSNFYNTENGLNIRVNECSFDHFMSVNENFNIDFAHNRFMQITNNLVKTLNCAAYIKPTNRILIFEKNSLIYIPLTYSEEYIKKIRFISLYYLNYSSNNQEYFFRFATLKEAVMAKLLI